MSKIVSNCLEDWLTSICYWMHRLECVVTVVVPIVSIDYRVVDTKWPINVRHVPNGFQFMHNGPVPVLPTFTNRNGLHRCLEEGMETKSHPKED